MEEWKEYRLGDLINISSGFAYKGEFIGNGENYLLGMGCVSFRDTFLVSGIRPYSGDAPDRYLAYSGDIVLATRQQSDNLPILGMPAIIPKKYDGHKMIIGANLYKVQNNSDFSNEYIYWLMKSPAYVHHIKSCQTGTTVRMITKANIEDFTFLAPQKETRDKIAQFFWNIENKIELNRRINENLEQQAQALFKSWFVDFEPFKDGKFVDSELGMIPEGWKVGTLSDIIKNTISGDWGKDHPQGNHVRKVFCIRGADIPDIKIGNKGSMPTRFILEKNYQSKVLIDGDVVIEISGGSPTQSTGRVCRISNRLLEKYNNSIICTNFCKAIKPSSGYSSFLYYIWEMLYNQGVMFSYENGTTGIKNLDINGFIQKEQIVIPPISIAADFEKMIKVFYDKIQSNGMESERLAQLRDTLLPKLMSGELKLSEIETELDE